MACYKGKDNAKRIFSGSYLLNQVITYRYVVLDESPVALERVLSYLHV